MKYARFAWMYCAALLLLNSCVNSVENRAPPAPDAVPQRIISVVPSATEMLFALGRGSNVIAIGDFDHYPPEVESLPRIGGLLNPNVERIIELKPDLVITYGSQDVLRDTLNDLGIRLYPFSHGNIDHTLQYMIDLGKVLGAESEAAQAVARIRKVFDEVRTKGPTQQPTILLVHNRGVGMLGSFYSVGSKAFQHELMTIAGGKNLFGDIDKEVIQPSLEEIISRSPEIIIETLPPGVQPDEAEQRKRDWQSIRNLPATRNNRIYIVSDDFMLVSGPRLDLAARRFADLITGR